MRNRILIFAGGPGIFLMLLSLFVVVKESDSLTHRVVLVTAGLAVSLAAIIDYSVKHLQDELTLILKTSVVILFWISLSLARENHLVSWTGINPEYEPLCRIGHYVVLAATAYGVGRALNQEYGPGGEDKTSFDG